MSRRRRAAFLAAAVLALVLATPVLALKPDKFDGKPGKGEGPPPHSSSVWNRTPAPEPSPAPRPTPHPHPSPAPDDPSPAPTDAPVLVLPDTATP